MYLALINPKAGNGGYQKIKREVEGLYRKLKLKVTSLPVEDLNNLPRLLKKELSEKNYKAIIIFGGQATLSAVIGALENKTTTPLAIVPLSKGRHLSDLLKLKKGKEAILAIKGGNILNFPLGKLGEHFFIGKLIVAPRQARVVTGNLLKASWKNLLKLLGGQTKTRRSIATTLEIDNSCTVKAQAIAIEIEPKMENSKPYLHISLETQAESSRAPSPTRMQAQKVKITSSLDMPVISGGELLTKTPVTIECLPETVPLILPKKNGTK